MRDYQPKKQNPYHLPHTLYRRVLALVRDYPRMVQVREAIIYESPENAGGRSSMGRPTENKALRIETLSDDIRAIERALDKIPREYRQGVLDEGKHAERVMTGTTDLFTKMEFDPWAEALGESMSAYEISWYLNSVQYENDTDFWHYEWAWEVACGKVRV